MVPLLGEAPQSGRLCEEQSLLFLAFPWFYLLPKAEYWFHWLIPHLWRGSRSNQEQTKYVHINEVQLNQRASAH